MPDQPIPYEYSRQKAPGSYDYSDWRPLSPGQKQLFPMPDEGAIARFQQELQQEDPNLFVQSMRATDYINDDGTFRRAWQPVIGSKIDPTYQNTGKRYLWEMDENGGHAIPYGDGGAARVSPFDDKLGWENPVRVAVFGEALTDWLGGTPYKRVYDPRMVRKGDTVVIGVSGAADGAKHRFVDSRIAGALSGGTGTGTAAHAMFRWNDMPSMISYIKHLDPDTKVKIVAHSYGAHSAMRALAELGARKNVSLDGFDPVGISEIPRTDQTQNMTVWKPTHGGVFDSGVNAWSNLVATIGGRVPTPIGASENTYTGDHMDISAPISTVLAPMRKTQAVAQVGDFETVSSEEYSKLRRDWLLSRIPGHWPAGLIGAGLGLGLTALVKRKKTKPWHLLLAGLGGYAAGTAVALGKDLYNGPPIKRKYDFSKLKDGDEVVIGLAGAGLGDGEFDRSLASVVGQGKYVYLPSNDKKRAIELIKDLPAGVKKHVIGYSAGGQTLADLAKEIGTPDNTDYTFIDAVGRGKTLDEAKLPGTAYTPNTRGLFWSNKIKLRNLNTNNLMRALGGGHEYSDSIYYPGDHCNPYWVLLDMKRRGVFTSDP